MTRENVAADKTRMESEVKVGIKGFTPYIKKSSKVLISLSEISKIAAVPSTRE